MLRAIRFDRGELKKPKRTTAGFLRADAYVTRVGVFNYLNADGTVRRELRHPDEVFDAASLETLHLIPVTREHPVELVTDSNAKGLAVGTTGTDAEKSGRFVRSSLQVTDGETIADIESRDKSDLSCGYECDKDLTPGVTKGIAGVRDGLKYDLVQRNIRYNHVAATARGRAGPEVSIPRMDSAGVDADIAVMVLDSDSRVSDPQPGASPMETIRIDGVDYKVSEQAAQAYRKQVADRAEAEAAAKKALDVQTARADAAEEDLKAEKKKGEDAKKKHDSTAGDEAIRKRVDARVKLVTDAAAVLKAKEATKDKDGKGIELSTMADADIRALVIKAASPDRNLDGKSEDYVSAAFDIVVDSVSSETTDADEKKRKAKQSRDGIQDAANSTTTTDDSEPDAEKSRAKMLDTMQNRWQETKDS
jgi:hypothetical protein